MLHVVLPISTLGMGRGGSADEQRTGGRDVYHSLGAHHADARTTTHFL